MNQNIYIFTSDLQWLKKKKSYNGFSKTRIEPRILGNTISLSFYKTSLWYRGIL